MVASGGRGKRRKMKARPCRGERKEASTPSSRRFASPRVASRQDPHLRSRRCARRARRVRSARPRRPFELFEWMGTRPPLVRRRPACCWRRCEERLGTRQSSCRPLCRRPRCRARGLRPTRTCLRVIDRRAARVHGANQEWVATPGQSSPPMDRADDTNWRLAFFFSLGGDLPTKRSLGDERPTVRTEDR